jgi:rare lipoprotein A
MARQNFCHAHAWATATRSITIRFFINISVRSLWRQAPDSCNIHHDWGTQLATPSRHEIHWRRIKFVFMGLIGAQLVACSSMPSSTPAPAPSVVVSAAPVRPSTANATPALNATPAAATVPALPPAGSGKGAYYQDDGPGDQIPDGLHALPDAEPLVEPYTKRGNRQYVVFGKTYTPFLDNRPFKQRGRGSWYGKKFHGQRTSSGERYDMYKMTAAHPTLPLPSYVRVTNIANGRQVIVRVNDRGPFHAGRIIDLSYTAALKLGYLQAGSAELEVERLLPDEILRMAAKRQAPPISQQPEVPASTAVAAIATPVTSATQHASQALKQTPSMAVQQPESKEAANAFAVPVAAIAESQKASAPGPSGFYLQLGAYSQASTADSARSKLQQQWAGVLPPIVVTGSSAPFRLISGPFATRIEAAGAAQTLRDKGVAQALIIRR